MTASITATHINVPIVSMSADQSWICTLWLISNSCKHSDATQALKLTITKEQIFTALFLACFIAKNGTIHAISPSSRLPKLNKVDINIDILPSYRTVQFSQNNHSFIQQY